MLAHVQKSESLSKVNFPSAKNQNVFNNDAIRKMGFNPFTGKQFLAAPTEKIDEIDELNDQNLKPPTEMIELELEDDD